MRALVLLVLLAPALAGCLAEPAPPASGGGAGPAPLPEPDAARLYGLAAAQVLKPDGTVRHRVPGTPGNAEVASWIANELAGAGAAVRFHKFVAPYRCDGPTAMQNVEGRLAGRTNVTIYFAAHYDTRPVAEKDRDVTKRQSPIPGANDGASGVAVVLELARLLAAIPNRTHTYVFLLFDAEDGGASSAVDGCNGKWAIGSETYAKGMSSREVRDAKALILFDLVGDRNLTMRKEGNSWSGPGKPIQERLWKIGAERGHSSVFVDLASWEIHDDHVPFLARGIPAVDLIHLDGDSDPFPSTHHTHADDLSNLSAESLRIVTDVAWAWVKEQEGRA